MKTALVASTVLVVLISSGPAGGQTFPPFEHLALRTWFPYWGGGTYDFALVDAEPYWLTHTGSEMLAEFGEVSGLWKVSYEQLGTITFTEGVDAVEQLPIYDPGANPHTYYYLIEDMRTGPNHEWAAGDRDFEDLILRVDEHPVLFSVNTLSGWTVNTFSFLTSDGQEIPFTPSSDHLFEPIPGMFVPGDIDLDDDADADDLALLCANIGGPAAHFDQDGDGDVDEDDFVFLVDNHLQIDTNGDGTPDGAGTYRGDFNTDGVVNLTDLQLMKAHFGSLGLGVQRQRLWE